VVYAGIGLGVGIAAMLTALLMGFAGVGVAGILILASLGVAPALGALFALRQTDELEELEDKLLYANVAVTSAAGTVALGFIAGLFGTIASSIATPQFGGGGGGGFGGGGGLGQVIIPLFLIAIGAAVAAAVAAWASRNLVGSAPVQQQQGR